MTNGPDNTREVYPDFPGLNELFIESDAYMSALYPSESNHMTELHALCESNSSIHAVVEDGYAVACAALVIGEPGVAEIKRMFVARSARGKGRGKALLRALLSIADAEGLMLQLETGVKQQEAIGLYASHGFKEAEPFHPYLPDPSSIFFRRERHNGQP